MTETILSKRQIPIRLTDERWQHIVTQHTELTGFWEQIIETITNPERILAGSEGE